MIRATRRAVPGALADDDELLDAVSAGRPVRGDRSGLAELRAALDEVLSAGTGQTGSPVPFTRDGSRPAAQGRYHARMVAGGVVAALFVSGSVAAAAAVSPPAGAPWARHGHESGAAAQVTAELKHAAAALDSGRLPAAAGALDRVQVLLAGVPGNRAGDLAEQAAALRSRYRAMRGAAGDQDGSRPAVSPPRPGGQGRSAANAPDGGPPDELRAGGPGPAWPEGGPAATAPAAGRGPGWAAGVAVPGQSAPPGRPGDPSAGRTAAPDGRSPAPGSAPPENAQPSSAGPPANPRASAATGDDAG